MLIYRFLKKSETYEQLIIRWANTLIVSSDYNGKLDKRGFTLDWLYSKSEPTQEEREEWLNHPSRAIREEVMATINKDHPTVITHTLTGHLDDVKKFLLKEGYINNIEVHKQEWILTDKGRLVKELGSHQKYKKHRKREINILKNQAKINFWLILATGLAAIMPFIAAWVFSTKVYNTNVLPAPVYRPDIRIDSVWLQNQVDALIQKRLSTLPQEEPTKQPPPTKATQ